MRRKNVGIISVVGLPDRTPTGGVTRSIRSLREYSKHFDTYLLTTPMQLLDSETLKYLYQEAGVKKVVNLESWYLFKKTLDNPRLRLGFMYPLIPRMVFNLSFKGLNKPEMELHGVIVLNELLHLLKMGQVVKEKLNIPSIALLQLPLMYSDGDRREKILEAYSLWYEELYGDEKVGKVFREWRTKAEFLVMHSRFVKNLLNSYDALVAVSRSILVEMRENFTNKFYVLDPGVSLSHEDIELIERIKRSSKSFKENYVVLGGRVDALKGFIEGVYAFKELSRSYPELKLIATGHVSDSVRVRIGRFLKRLGLEEKVVLTGVLPRSEILEIVAKAKLMLYPSHVDAFPYAVLESLHLGTPIVAYDIPALRIHYAYCPGVILVKEGDVVALASEAINIMDTGEIDVKPPPLPSWDEILSKEISIISKLIA